ncbi:MAG: single-stranded DNA-binding protein [Treponema sp.]|nr:single-stranded DNA-binding protein [Treponema sp.]
MSDINALFLQGRLTKDASMNTMSNGSCVVTLSLASNKDYQDRNSKQWVKQTHFFEVSYWGEPAKNNLAEFTKGREVIVEGELRTSSWEKDGKKYSRMEIRANRVKPLRRPGEGKRIDSKNASGSAYPDAPEAPNFDEIPPRQYDENGEPIPF